MIITSFIIVFLVSFLAIYFLAKRFALDFHFLSIAWGIKIFYAIAFTVIFSHYYGSGELSGDAYRFYKDGQVLYEYGHAEPVKYLKLLVGINPDQADFLSSHLMNTDIWDYGDNGDNFNDNRLIIRINSVIHFYSHGNTYIHAISMAFLSFIGLVLLFKAFENQVKNPKLFFWCLVAFPSLGFWSSGLTKESILIFALGLFFFSFFNLLHRFKWSVLITLLIGAALLILNKPHVGIIVLGTSTIMLIGKASNWQAKWRILFPVSLFIIGIALTFTPAKINLLHKVSYKQRDLINIGKGGIFFINDSAFCAFDYAHLKHFQPIENKKVKVLKSTPGSYKLFGEEKFFPYTVPSSEQAFDLYLILAPSESFVNMTPIDYERGNLIKTLPEVAVNTILRPFPWDSGSNLKYLSLLNNLLFIGFILFVAFHCRKIEPEQKYIGTFLITSSIILLLIIGWTTPITGAIVRYKMAAELFVIIYLFILLKPLKHEIHPSS
jgi:hypothetical protein